MESESFGEQPVDRVMAVQRTTTELNDLRGKNYCIVRENLKRCVSLDAL